MRRGELEIEIIDSAKKIKYQKQKDTETAEEEEEGEEEEKEVETPAVGKTNDPVRLYLREMGMVNLLTREGEVEIAKRIEAGEHQVRKEAIHTPSAIQESLLLADRIRSDWVEMKASSRISMKSRTEMSRQGSSRRRSCPSCPKFASFTRRI